MNESRPPPIPRPLPAPSMRLIPAAAAALTLAACTTNDPKPEAPDAAPATSPAEAVTPAAPEWVPLFNGRDLDGWTPKFAGHPLGVNLLDTFRVEDGLLTVSYENYDTFDKRFGHLFFDGEFSSYSLRAVYRFVGEQCPGAPGWARRNNGLMIHGQDPATMAEEQDFPVSIEAQMLGQSEGGGERANGSLCTPGTNVVMNGEVVTDHCIGSTGPTNRGDEWVEMLVEVDGHGTIEHFINGEKVHSYSSAQLDPNNKDAQALLAAGAELALDRGTISIQAESHPIQFKTLEIRVRDAR